ncbi:AGAP007089-PA-like protein [Anopheles sinensis]|uniref:AGAP007089-PA-like protein n=1 Tax=Anopheles sinensis TaxID=74873 RepID=A0A084VZ25_ANOSI|nr:AGAP007089-PA-like protein [Anopheles sinensis]
MADGSSAAPWAESSDADILPMGRRRLRWCDGLRLDLYRCVGFLNCYRPASLRADASYYADVEARCQVFRVCANTDSTGRGFAFLCPNGTLFNQRHLVCDWYMNVRCAESENFYHVNEEIGRMVANDGRSMVSDNRQEMMEVVMSMVMYPMRSLMEQMDGVGVLEERFGSGKDVRPVLPAVPKAPIVPKNPTREGLPVGPSTYLTPVRTELEPPRMELRAPVPVNNYAPVGRPSLSPNKQSEPPRVYTPRVDDVYVSSLGTLSTDPDSGFDPVRSTLLTRTGGSVTGTTAKGIFPAPGFAGLQQTNQAAAQKPSVVSKSGPSDVQLVKADLVKTWNGPDRSSAPRPKPLKLAPVPPSPAPPVFQRAQPQPTFVERFPQTTPRKDPELLPPTGVLPPTSFTRTVPIGQQQFDSRLQTGYPEHRFTPARKVLSVQKVTVQPEYPYQTSSGAVAIQGTPTPSAYPVQRPHGDHVSTGNLYQTHGVPSVVTSVPAQETYVQQPAYVPQQYYYQTASNPVVTGSAQEGYAYPAYYYHTNGASISHRYETAAPDVQQVPAQVYPQSFQGTNSRSSFVTAPALLRRSDGPLPGLLKRKKTVLVQVVPSVSFYLNDAEEKRAYDAAVRRGLLDDRRRSTLTSYEVPQGSVGQLAF